MADPTDPGLSPSPGAHPAHPALAGVAPAVVWLDRPGAPARRRPLEHDARVDLVVVGGGYTGLWAAIEAVLAAPHRRVMVIEADAVGTGASGRNGGFADASITHGLRNGLAHFPAEIETLLALGRDNFTGLLTRLDELGIDADVERTGQLVVATAPWQLDALRDDAALLARHGEDVEWLDGPALRDQVDSPTYLGGYWQRSNVAGLDPARLVWGLAAAAERLGVTIHDDTFALALRPDARGIDVVTGRATVRADRVLLATNAFPPLLSRIRHWVVPVWDYVLATEPLTDAQRAAIGWTARQGISDAGNQFHYYRLSADQRIVWGGYDAMYLKGDQVGAHLAQRPASADLLAEHFFATFPQLQGLRFTHHWGGPIASTSRFCAMFGAAHGGRVAYSLGYTGLGVVASRFGARVALDLLDGADTPRTRLQMVRRKPVPFPPPPLRNPIIQWTRRSIAAADAHEGRRNAWLRLLDRLGIGFDS